MARNRDRNGSSCDVHHVLLADQDVTEPSPGGLPLLSHAQIAYGTVPLSRKGSR